MTSIEARARAKLEKAERKAGSLSMTMTTGGVGGVVSRLYNSLFNTLGGGGGGGDNSEACELYTEAANLFKAARMWTEAGDAFLRCAALNESGQREDRYDAAASYSEAGNCFRKVDVKKAINSYEKAAALYIDAGRFSSAARIHVTVGELCEAEMPNDKQLRLKHYEKAADYYAGEESKSTAQRCAVKVAMLSAELGDYHNAFKRFEEIADCQASHPALMYSAKSTYFNALLCRFLVDVVDTKQALSRYEERSPTFADSRECALVKELVECVEQERPDLFDAAILEHLRTHRLDEWSQAMLDKVKKLCGDEKRAMRGDEDEEDEEDLR